MLAVFHPPGAHAEDDEFIAVEEKESEIIDLEEEEEVLLTGEEPPAYEYHGIFELPENVTWKNGRLLLNFNLALIGEVGVQHGGQACASYSLICCRTILDGIACSYADFSRLNDVVVIGFENVPDGLPISPYYFLILEPGEPYYDYENMDSLGLDLKKDDGKYRVEYDTTSGAAPFVLNNSDYLSEYTESFLLRRLFAYNPSIVMSLPFDARLNGESRELGVLQESEYFMFTVLVRNNCKEFWFIGKTEDGVSGCVFAEIVAKDLLSGEFI